MIENKMIEKIQERYAELLKLREQRIEEAKNKKLYAKLIAVATVLGKREHGEYNRWTYIDTSVGIKVTYNNYVPGGHIIWKNKEVFTVHLNDILRYNPGKWEDELERLYSVADKVYQQEKIKRKLKEIEDLEERWLALKE